MRAIVIFLTTLLFVVGCGVMNNPDTNSEIFKGDDGSVSNEAGTMISAKIDVNNLVLTDQNRQFTDRYNSYRVFESLVSTNLFLSDLNDSAQTLTSEDMAIVNGWIDSIKSANINYQEKNLLFYPIMQDEDCGIKTNIDVSDHNATITLKKSKTVCKKTTIYYPLLYVLDKSIENITIVPFDEDVVKVVVSTK